MNIKIRVMNEKDLAERICEKYAQRIVDENEGFSLGGISLGEEYAKMMYREGGHDVMQISQHEMALRHWVAAVGYAEVGKFQIIMSNYIQNC